MRQTLFRAMFGLAIGILSTSSRAEVSFRKHVIDPAFRAEAVAAADINRDGKLDIIAGENWY